MKNKTRLSSPFLRTKDDKAAVGDKLEAGVTVEKIKSRHVTVNENGKPNIYRLKRLNF